MKKTLLLTVALILGLAINAQDSCANAAAITLGLHTVTAVDGAEIPMPICAENGDGATAGEWFTYTPTNDHYLTITTDLAQNDGGDTRFHVYTGTCGSLVCHAGNDDIDASNNNYLSIDSFNVTAGTTYIVAFDNKWSSGGFDFELIETVAPPPPPISFAQESLAVSGSYSGVVDMDADFVDDVVGISNDNLNMHYQLAEGGFLEVDIATTYADNMPSWSLAAGDYNADGYNDLLYGGSSGVTFMQSNSGSTFTEVSGGEYVFSQRSNFVDINNDGHLDAFVCHDVQPNVYYLNDGQGNLTFYQGTDSNGVPSGLGLHPEGGNYGTIWIDIDNDHNIDLFIAKCRGGASTAKINELWHNNGDGTFTEIAGDTGVNMADPVQTWSSAWGDFNNDSYMDAFVGANSFSDGGHKLMLNNGDGTFTDVTASSGLDTYDNSGRENTAHDFDNDGFIDIASNGDILINNGDMTFTVYENLLPNSNGSFGDLNNDGFMDSFSNGTIYYNNANNNNWLKVFTQGSQSNYNGIGARVEVHTASGVQVRDVRSGDGFANLSTLNTHFGLGSETVDSVVVYWPSGVIDMIETPNINTFLHLVEGSTLSVEDPELTSFSIYPNPADDLITVNAQTELSGKMATVFNLQGKKVLNAALSNNTIDVSSLASGTYVLRLESKGKSNTVKFVKK